MAGRGTDIKLGGNPEFRAQKRAGTQATAEQYAQAYKIEKEAWLADYEAVKQAGGLYVIGTERHESRRIDNQLRGRSGRQGDPGRSKFYISMDDDLMRLFGGEKMKSIMSRIGMEPGEPIYHPWLTKGIKKAQKKVEERNFEIRKHLLDYDDVLNEQRRFIYGQRDAILVDEDLKLRILQTARESAEQFAQSYTDALRKGSATNEANLDALAELNGELKQNFGLQIAAETLAGLSNVKGSEARTEFVTEAIVGELERDIGEKEALAGKENLNMFIRFQYLQAIDKRWLDHLENLEALREAVYLRSYGQKNPLTEYKLEGFDIFYSMLDEIRLEIASRLVLVQISVEDESAVSRQARTVQGTAQHNSLEAFNGGTALSGKSRPENAQVVRITPKVGRNDPCPCGSGKKYKHCCGRNA